MSEPNRGQMMEIHCPHCGRMVGKFVAGDYRYGSPIKICPKCKNEYINPVIHEIEVDGISPDAFDMKKLLMVILMGIVFFVIAAAVHYYEITTQDYYHTSCIAIMIISAIIIVYSLANILFIKTGIKAKWTEGKRQESVKRMNDPEYALKLKEFGFDVPDKYLPQEYTENNNQN